MMWFDVFNKPRLTMAAGITIALYGSSQASDFSVIPQRTA